MMERLKFCTMLMLQTFCIGFPFQAFSQQINIHGEARTYQWTASSNSFNDRFNCFSQYEFTVDSSEAFKLKRVKKVEILGLDSSIHFMMEFDSSGHLLKTGYGGNSCRYFRVWQNGFLRNGLTVNSSEYYENKKLQRIDSSIEGTIRVRKDDTLFVYKYSINKIYKSGTLLNEQGRYYNQLIKKVPSHFKYLPWRLKVKIYAKKAIKCIFVRSYETSYEEDRFYLSRENKYVYYAGFTVGSDTLPAIHYSGSMSSWLKKQIYTRYYCRCETYLEKVVERNLPGCYTDKARFDEEQNQLNSNIKYSFDKNGLHTGYYKNGYPVFFFRYTYFD